MNRHLRRLLFTRRLLTVSPRIVQHHASTSVRLCSTKASTSTVESPANDLGSEDDASSRTKKNKEREYQAPKPRTLEAQSVPYEEKDPRILTMKKHPIESNDTVKDIMSASEKSDVDKSLETSQLTTKETVLERLAVIKEQMTKLVQSKSVYEQEQVEKVYPDYVSKPVSTHFRNEKNVEWDPDISLTKRVSGGVTAFKEEMGVGSANFQTPEKFT